MNTLEIGPGDSPQEPKAPEVPHKKKGDRNRNRPPLDNVAIQANMVVTDAVIHDVKKGVLCGCPNCKGNAEDAIDWLLEEDAPEEYKKEIFNRIRK